MCLFQTVHHQMVCHLQCTCFRQFATRWCVICNVPISDSSPPDGVSSAMCLFQTVYHQMVCHLLMCLFQTVLHQMVCHLQCVCFRPFTAKRCVIFNIPVSASNHQIVCHLQCACLRQFTTRWCVIFNVPVSASSPPDSVSSAMYLFQHPRRFAAR